MELDELKTIWARNEEQLARSERLCAELLRQWNLRKGAGALRRLFGGLVLELVLDLAGIVLIGSFAADHFHEPAFFVPALLLGIYAIAIVAAVLGQAAVLAGIDYDEPVVAIQQRLERLRVRRIRTTLATLLFAPLMWLPLAIVAMKGLFGVNITVADPRWLLATVLFGLAVIPLAIFAAKRYGPRLNRSSGVRALADEIAGRSLRTALDDLATIGHFAEENAGGIMR